MRIESVKFINGVYTTQLGDTNRSLNELDFKKQYWLTLKIGDENSSSEISPRQRFSAVPYSLNAIQIEKNLINAIEENSTEFKTYLLNLNAKVDANGSKLDSLSLSLDNNITALNINLDERMVTRTWDNDFNGKIDLNKLDASYTLPSADGTNGQVLITNGSGTVSWTTPSSGGSSEVNLSSLSSRSVILNSSGATATGTNAFASGNYSTAIGYQTNASSMYSTTMGYATIADQDNMLAVGKYNSLNNTNALFVVGNGDAEPSNAFSVYRNGSATISRGLNQNSDERLKKDITPIENSLEKVQAIRGVNYHWIDAKSDQTMQMGVIAQDVQKVAPELVKTDNQGYLSVSYTSMNGLLVEAIKEQQKEIDELKETNKKLILALQKLGINLE